MRLAYLDCFAGVSGELILGALIDAGLSLGVLRSELARVSLPPYAIEAQQVAVSGISGTQVVVTPVPATNVVYLHPEEQSSLSEPVSYSEVISSSDLAPEVKRRSLAALKLLNDAEHTVFPPRPASPHDALRDTVLVVAVASGFALLGVQNVVCSSVNVGGGIVYAGQNTGPVPSPAVARILQTASVPIYGTEANRELVTPVGAALVVAMASSFGPAPAMPVSALGYALSGAPTTPGLRVILGDLRAEENPARPVPATIGNGLSGSAGTAETDRVALLEATLDDTNPQYYDFIIERLLWQGAQEVFLVPVQIRLNRPGVLLSVLCDPARADVLAQLIFEETGADNVRMREMTCRAVRSEIAEVSTRWGPVRVKVSRDAEGHTLHVKPDYEEVKVIALTNNVPVERVHEEVRFAYNPLIPDTHQHPGRQRFPLDPLSAPRH